MQYRQQKTEKIAWEHSSSLPEFRTKIGFPDPLQSGGHGASLKRRAMDILVRTDAPNAEIAGKHGAINMGVAHEIEIHYDAHHRPDAFTLVTTPVALAKDAHRTLSAPSLLHSTYEELHDAAVKSITNLLKGYRNEYANPSHTRSKP